ncbi:1-deoxy-D-xylulose-5-phosphate reductoisomerase [Paenibacillus allorhizosphaerae]|uniref:1-deoxy-D-xylulose 5-phosphate reductoisomerase n=1 Tax=Paenibacillus allorhizosphaerae TaxID=2849866 RepID=A0ABM8VCG2_9BACL|nr:1-deoxy-D-xylulose-5-phosphate reductoisomerase [Paenibacillus allorhizosphaerae]CAG7623850.1 1-deoxy-D-xylulose 5-phosphate reductoisomerase [Paenibacillus allorhizosphaerae]
MKKISILGSTGSIGTQTLDVVSHHPDLFSVEGIAGGYNISLLAEQIRRFHPKKVSVATKALADQLAAQVPSGVQLFYGPEGLLEVAAGTEADIVVTALVGSQGLQSTLAAIEAGKQIGLANKETLVSAGHLVTKHAAKCGVKLLPIDSEHSAIFQCLNGESLDDIHKITLTASGGSFRDRTREELKDVTVAEALKHPNWSMGAKITIDSATMANKGLEVIEAHWLFGLSYDQIEVLIHPESIIHSFVEFKDYSIIAQLGLPDMRVPIQYALTYPQRLPTPSARLRLSEIGRLNFREMDYDRFPCLRMAFESGRAGGSTPSVFNAANEVAVERFLQGKIKFLQIEDVIAETLDKHEKVDSPELEQIIEIDRWARHTAAII